jgi:hypothetical protein
VTALRRFWRPLSFLAATGLAIAGIAGAGSAGAGSPPAPPDYTYSSDVTAIGVQVALQQNPELSSLPDPFDIRTPESDGQLDSFGTSTADGHIGNLNGLGGIPGLICLAAGAATCAEIPIGAVTGGLIPTFPPPDPLDAHTTYPAHQEAKAPVLGKTPAQASFASSGFSLDAASSQAAAHQYDTMSRAVDQGIDIGGALSIGSATTSSTQVATADALTTTATARLSDIGLGNNLLSIASMKSTTTVVSKPHQKPTDKTTTVLSGVKVAGLAATIDADGIRINSNGLPANLVAQVQKLVNQLLGKAGIKISLAKVTRTDDDSGHTVAASSLLFTFDHTVSGVQPIVIAPPQGVPCPIHLPQPFPIDPCSGVSLTLNAHYHGQIALGQVGVVSSAQPGGLDNSVPPPVGVPSVGPGDGGVPAGGPLPSTPPGSELGGPASGSTPPVIAPHQRQVADQLEDVSGRLEWFFPLFALGLLALIGRLRTPARLPSPGNPRT